MGLKNNLNNENLEVLNNISNCINDKLAILNIKLSELARDADVDYFSLRKLINHEENYMPNLRILIKLSEYLNIQVGDLLKYNSLPQYVPIIDQEDIYTYLKAGATLLHGFKNKVFSEKFIHEKSFAIKEINNELLLPTEIIYICYPNPYKKILINQVYLFEIDDEKEKLLVFSRVYKINSNNIEIVVHNKHECITKYNVIAIVVSMQACETFI
ncbi:MAG: helix-turn-helix domain-containing protein [Proteobacteria bacterium]|nr:helix-turn-helix domain-containing protein [Pseudomonadota bacterium]